MRGSLKNNRSNLNSEFHFFRSTPWNAGPGAVAEAPEKMSFHVSKDGPKRVAAFRVVIISVYTKKEIRPLIRDYGVEFLGRIV